MTTAGRRTGSAGPAANPHDDAVRVGDAVRLLDRMGRQFAAMIRLVTVPLAAFVALRAAAPAQEVAVTVTVACLACWSTVYIVALLRKRSVTVVTVIDSVVLAAVVLTMPLTVPGTWLASGQPMWIVAFVSFGCVAYQVHTSAALGAWLAVGVHVALIGAVATSLPAQVWAANGYNVCWSLVAALLARIMWMLVRRGGRIADRLTADAEEARTAQRVAAAVRADERLLANALHDTAATTLLMVGTGQVPVSSDQLAAQARRDLAVLRGYGHRGVGRDDLILRLRAAADLPPLRVEFSGPAHLVLPAHVVDAIAAAAGAALDNVRRHARTDLASIRVKGDEGQDAGSVLVSISDRGTGFAVDEVGDTRRGLRSCVLGRMQEIDGVARIVSVPGQGTDVDLEWRRG